MRPSAKHPRQGEDQLAEGILACGSEFGLAQSCGGIGHGGIDDRIVERILAAEIVGDHRAVDPRGGGDFGDRGAANALFSEESRCRGQDQLAGGLALGRGLRSACVHRSGNCLRAGEPPYAATALTDPI